MSNLCLNHLIVYGQTEEIKKYFEDCREDKSNDKDLDFSFAPLVPLLQEDNGNGRKSWGTEVDANVQFLNLTSSDGTVTFETAWNPPVTWFTKITSLYPGLHFILSFYEPNNQLAGFMQGKRGVTNYKECADWHEYVHFIYSGEPDHSFQFDRSCIDCCKIEVSVEDIIKHEDVLCVACYNRKIEEGGVVLCKF